MTRASSASAVVILNASSGWTAKEDIAEVMQSELIAAGWPCSIQRVDAGADITTIAKRAVRDGASRVVAGGGDGTIRSVAQALVGTDVEFGILPCGTLNHFARDMEIPLDLQQAAVVAAASGVPVCIDAAEVNGHTFINNSVIGLYPYYRSWRDSREAGGANSGFAILSAMYHTLRIYPHLTVRLGFADAEIVRRTPYLLIANNEHAMHGMKPWQREQMTEGGLWVYVLRDRNRMALLRLVAKMISGANIADEEFEVFRSREVFIETKRRSLRIAIDGEIIESPIPLRYRSRPGQLKVLVPPDSKRLTESLCPRDRPNENDRPSL